MGFHLFQVPRIIEGSISAARTVVAGQDGVLLQRGSLGQCERTGLVER